MVIITQVKSLAQKINNNIIVVTWFTKSILVGYLRCMFHLYPAEVSNAPGERVSKGEAYR